MGKNKGVKRLINMNLVLIKPPSTMKSMVKRRKKNFKCENLFVDLSNPYFVPLACVGVFSPLWLSSWSCLITIDSCFDFRVKRISISEPLQTIQ